MNNTIISILAGLGGMFGWGTSDYFANLSSDKIGHFKTFFWSQVAGMFCLAIIFFLGNNFAGLNLKYAFILLTSSIFYAIGYLFFYKAFEIGTVSVVSSTINLNVVFAMILALVFLGESLTSIQAVAVSIVILGVTLVSLNLKELKEKKASLALGVKEAVLASVAFAIYWNLDKVLSVNVGWLFTAFSTKVVALVFLIVLSLARKQELAFKMKSKKVLSIVALVGILEAFAVASVNWGLSVGQVVLVSPISSALSIVTIGLAIIFLKEKISKIQALGILLTIGGIVMTAL